MTAVESQIWFVFNELSARVSAPTIHQGRRRMDDMVSAVATMMVDRAAVLVTVGEPNLWAAELAPGYTVANWLSGGEHDPNRDLKSLLLRIASKIGLPEEADEALRNRFHLSEFVLSPRVGEKSGERVEARGLGAAVLFAGIGISLRSEDQWSRLRIPLRHTWLDENCQEQSDDVEALNLSASSQIEALSGYLIERRRRDLRGNPLTLADRKHECFPHLEFGLDVDGHLEALPPEILQVVVGKLVILDAVSRAWRSDPTMTSPQLPQCNPESEATMQQFGDQRTFRNPEGGRASYRLHAMVGSAYRIHLRVTHEPRGIEIGYIGRHLDTVRHH